MTSSDTLVTAPPEKSLHGGLFGIEPRYRPIEDETLVTLVEGTIGLQKAEVRAIDRTYVVWDSLDDYETVISYNLPLASLFMPLNAARLRQPRIPTRYSDAAQELRDLLPSVGLDTLAKMCGVSDTGFRNWLRGKGIREKQLRRLLSIRSLVRALVIQRGATAANEWMHKPHPKLDSQSPIEAIADDRLEDVLPLALTWKSPHKPSLLPEVEEGEVLDAHEMAAEQGLAPVEVFTAF